MQSSNKLKMKGRILFFLAHEYHVLLVHNYNLLCEDKRLNDSRKATENPKR